MKDPRYVVRKDAVGTLWGLWDEYEGTWGTVRFDDATNYSGVPMWPTHKRAKEAADLLNAQLEATAPPTHLSPDDQLRIRQALLRLPYSSDVSGYWRQSVRHTTLTADDIVAGLDAFAGILTKHAEKVTKLEERHRQLTADVAAMRRVLGTSG